MALWNFDRVGKTGAVEKAINNDVYVRHTTYLHTYLHGIRFYYVAKKIDSILSTIATKLH